MDNSSLVLKQDLNRVINRIKLKRPVISLFLEGVKQLLNKLNPAANEKEVQLHLQNWVAGTAFVGSYPKPESYNSPVCYASLSGLREGFNMDEFPESSQSLPEPCIAYSSIAKLEDNIWNSKEIVQLTRLWLSEVVRTWQEKQPVTCSDVTKQIETLVCQLYGFEPKA